MTQIVTTAAMLLLSSAGILLFLRSPGWQTACVSIGVILTWSGLGLVYVLPKSTVQSEAATGDTLGTVIQIGSPIAGYVSIAGILLFGIGLLAYALGIGNNSAGA